MNWRLGALALWGATGWAQPGGGTGDGVWARNAAYGELETFDGCNGHQPQSGMYHHHINPVCLRAQLNDNVVTVATRRLGTQYAEKTRGIRKALPLGETVLVQLPAQPAGGIRFSCGMGMYRGMIVAR